MKTTLGLAATLFLVGSLAVSVPQAQAATMTIAELQSQVEALREQLGRLMYGGSADCETFDHDLTIGSTGPDVAALQRYLMTNGHFASALGATGYFGDITRSAVAQWQTANGIAPAVGYFGKQSQARYGSLCRLGEAVPSSVNKDDTSSDDDDSSSQQTTHSSTTHTNKKSSSFIRGTATSPVGDNMAQADFELEFRLTAFNGSFYIPRSLARDDDPSDGSDGFEYVIEGSGGDVYTGGSVANTVSADGSDSGDTAGHFKVSDGKSRTFTVKAFLDNQGATAGFYGLQLTAIRFDSDTTAGGEQTLSAGLGNYETNRVSVGDTN